jgi:hypothetical protein
MRVDARPPIDPLPGASSFVNRELRVWLALGAYLSR